MTGTDPFGNIQGIISTNQVPDRLQVSNSKIPGFDRGIYLELGS
jgi:hypothetical protein